MIQQRINLYRGGIEVQPDLSCKRILQVWGAFALLLGLYYGVVEVMNDSKVEKVQVMEQQQRQLKNQVDSGITGLSNTEQQEILQREIDGLVKERNEKAQMVGILRSQGLGRDAGFSPYLEALANSHVSGTWFTSISIRSNGNYVELRGKANAAHLVPSIFKSLEKESVYDGKSFGRFEIKQESPDKPIVTFVAQTEKASES